MIRQWATRKEEHSTSTIIPYSIIWEDEPTTTVAILFDEETCNQIVAEHNNSSEQWYLTYEVQQLQLVSVTHTIAEFNDFSTGNSLIYWHNAALSLALEGK